MDSEGHYQIINAELPLACLHDYSTALKAMSSGRGMFNQEFSHYEDMPPNEAQKVMSSRLRLPNENGSRGFSLESETDS